MKITRPVMDPEYYLVIFHLQRNTKMKKNYFT